MAPSSPAASTIRTNTLGFRRDLRPPRTGLPAGACDAHMHIVGPQASYPFTATRSLSPPEATWRDYRGTMRVLGLSRCVIVQASFYGADNRCTLDAVAESEGCARAVVVVAPDVTRDEIARMHAQGARGVRLQMVAKGGVDLGAMEPIAAQIAPFGWHLQLYLDAEELPALAARLRGLPVPLVFDHMAHVVRGNGLDSPGFRLLIDLLGEGRAWVKLSNALFTPSAERARRLVAANPERVLWGTDWPHVALGEDGVPDDAALVDDLAAWIPDPAVRRQALVTNPDALYFRD